MVVDGDLVAGVQAEEVRDVPVLRLGVVVVLDPFLKAAGLLADLERCELGEGLLALGPEVRVGAQDLARFDAVGEQVVDDFQVHRGGVGEHGAAAVGLDEGVLGRVRRVR